MDAIARRAAASRSVHKWVCRSALAFLAMATVMVGCSRKSAGDAKSGKHGPSVGPPVPVLVAQPVGKNVPVPLRAIGHVTPISKVTVRSQITGRLASVNFQEGQPVNRGDLLFTINPRPPQVALEQAKANLARDEAQLENARIQFDRGV